MLTGPALTCQNTSAGHEWKVAVPRQESGLRPGGPAQKGVGPQSAQDSAWRSTTPANEESWSEKLGPANSETCTNYRGPGTEPRTEEQLLNLEVCAVFFLLRLEVSNRICRLPSPASQP